MSCDRVVETLLMIIPFLVEWSQSDTEMCHVTAIGCSVANTSSIQLAQGKGCVGSGPLEPKECLVDGTFPIEDGKIVVTVHSLEVATYPT